MGHGEAPTPGAATPRHCAALCPPAGHPTRHRTAGEVVATQAPMATRAGAAADCDESNGRWSPLDSKAAPLDGFRFLSLFLQRFFFRTISFFFFFSFFCGLVLEFWREGLGFFWVVLGFVFFC